MTKFIDISNTPFHVKSVAEFLFDASEKEGVTLSLQSAKAKVDINTYPDWYEVPEDFDFQTGDDLWTKPIEDKTKVYITKDLTYLALEIYGKFCVAMPNLDDMGDVCGFSITEQDTNDFDLSYIYRDAEHKLLMEQSIEVNTKAIYEFLGNMEKLVKDFGIVKSCDGSKALLEYKDDFMDKPVKGHVFPFWHHDRTTLTSLELKLTLEKIEIEELISVTGMFEDLYQLSAHLSKAFDYFLANELSKVSQPGAFDEVKNMIENPPILTKDTKFAKYNQFSYFSIKPQDDGNFKAISLVNGWESVVDCYGKSIDDGLYKGGNPIILEAVSEDEAKEFLLRD